MALSPFGAGFGAFDMFPFGRGNVMRDPFELVLPSLAQVAPAAGHAAHPLDVIETPDAFKVVVDVPGMSADDISIQLSEGVLTIAGRKKRETEERDQAGRTIRRERHFESFNRSFTLPADVKADDIGASLADGVLSVTVPKVAPPPKPEPRRIKVHPAANGGGAEAVPKVTHHRHHHHKEAGEGGEGGAAVEGGEAAMMAEEEKPAQ